MMLTLVVLPLACWLCALLAAPRKPRLGNEVDELVYARLVGQRYRVALLALVVTLGAFVVLITILSRRA